MDNDEFDVELGDTVTFVDSECYEYRGQVVKMNKNYTAQVLVDDGYNTRETIPLKRLTVLSKAL